MKTASRIEAIHPLTPLQEGILFHSLAAPEAGLYVVQPVFELEGELDAVLLRQAAEVVVGRHAALRTGFVWQGQERPRQVVHRRVETPWEERDLGAGKSLAAFLDEDRRRGLDPARAPLCRFSLLRAGERRHLLVVTHHHLVLDGWSMPIVTRELAAAYGALRAGAPVDLPPARPFGDYAAWLARRPADASEAFWREALRGLRAPTPLVVDTVARAAEGGRPLTGRARTALEGAPAARLREFGRRQKLAFATLAQAAWALLLSRCSGERDVLFGVVVSGRSADLEGVEGIVGMFVNSLPVRVRVPRRAPLLPWLREVQAGLAALREHEHCSLTQVQAWSELPQGTPIFESLLAVQTLGPISPELRLDGLSIRPVAGEERVGLPLTVVAYPAPGDGVWLGVEYDRRRIPPEAAAPLLDHYGRALTCLASAADVDAVELLPARSLLVPPTPAVLPEAGRSGRAAAIAARMREDGIGPESVVTVTSRGPDRALLAEAVLLAGAACRPLDRQVTGLPGAERWLDGPDLPVAPPPPPAPPAALAWVLETPDGPLGLPRAALDALPGLAAALGITAGDRVLVEAAPGSAEELLHLRLPSAATLASATVAIGPPGAWEAWAREPDLGRLLAVVTSEPAPPALAAELARRCRGLRSLAAGCAGDPMRQAGLGGAPPPGLGARVLDAEMRPLPAGATGEVWLAGDALPRGWQAAAGLTAARLRPDPLGRPGGRMLRTGWRARLRPDGDLELLGPREPGAEGARPAVAAAEVEALLAGHPAVRRAVVAGEAFAVLAPGASGADLRAHLRRQLPAHLVPSRVHVVERLPLDAAGRVDRRRLGAPAAREAAEPADDLLHRLAQAPAERRARFLARLRAELAQPDAEPALRARAPGDPVQPSFQQEQFWVLERLAQGESAHNVSLTIDLVDTSQVAVAAALEGLAARHEVLRCALLETAAGLAVEVAPPGPVALAVTDLASLPGPERQAEAARLATAEARLAFDLTAPPLLRARLLLDAGAGARLVLVVPHVATDPASARILTRDLLALEAAARTGAPDGLPALPLQYPDYARWQRERLERRRDALLAYWRQQLHGWQTLEPVTDRPRTPRFGPEGAGARLHLPAELVAGLESAAPGAGLRAVLLAGYVELLHRWSGQPDVLLGMGVDLRDRQELAGVAGDFGNHVVLRVDAGGRPSLEELARRAARVLAEAHEHRDLPFSALVEALQPSRDPGRLPLFQVAFSYEEETRGAGAGGPPADGVDSGRIPYELVLICVRTGTGARVTLGGNRNLFDAETLERMAGALRTLLEAAARVPGRPLADLPLLAPDRERALLAWSGGGPAEPGAAGIGERFAARAAARPDAVALVHAGSTVTYGELGRRVSAIAHALRRRGQGPEDRVGILLERGPDMVAAVLGVLTAGAAYVPLDPSHPPARTALVLADAGVRLALTQRALAGRLESASCPALELDGGALDGLPGDPPAPPAGPGNLAYVLHTSGSTGRPKGVMVEQRSVAGFAAQIAAAYGVDDRSRVLGMAPLTFDLSVFEIFTALLTGASLHLAGEEDRLQPERLQRLLREERVTVAELPPALMPMLDPDALPDLRLVSVGGEAFGGELVGRWWRPGRRFVNGYGPTEATVAVTLRDCEGAWDRMPPIGRPMPGQRAYVLDAGLRPVPAGMPGELCLGGLGLARGYLGRPDLTAERFVPDPHGEPGSRVYRTGDRAYWLPSGELQLLGRLDRQVKVRGHRVELGEVEAAVARLDGVRQAAVEALPDEAGRLQLVAYLAGEWRPDVAELRSRLEADLPAYLLPARVVQLERLPLTARGKVDRRALPPPAAGGPAEVTSSPRTWIEERIAGEVVGPLLQAGAVDVERNFFELGGNSLEAIQVVSRAAEAFDVELDLGEFLAEPTVRRLARQVEAAQAAGAQAGDLLAQILAEVETLSEEEAERLLREMEAGSPSPLEGESEFRSV